METNKKKISNLNKAKDRMEVIDGIYVDLAVIVDPGINYGEPDHDFYTVKAVDRTIFDGPITFYSLQQLEEFHDHLTEFLEREHTFCHGREYERSLAKIEAEQKASARRDKRREKRRRKRLARLGNRRAVNPQGESGEDVSESAPSGYPEGSPQVTILDDPDPGSPVPDMPPMDEPSGEQPATPV